MGSEMCIRDRADLHSIASLLGYLGLQPGLECPGDGAWELVEGQFKAGGAENWDQTKMEPQRMQFPSKESIVHLKHLTR